MSVDFVAIDFETANRNRASACSVGMIKVKNGYIVDSFYSLINPEEEFDSFNTSIHGITEAMIENKPTYKDLVYEILDFIDSLPLVAHYSPFDMGVIRDSNERYNIINFKATYFDSYFLSKQLIETISYRLVDLSKLLSIDLKHHNAASDAEACAKIVLYLCEKNSVSDILELNRLGRYYKLGIIDGYLGSGFKKKKKYNGRSYDIKSILSSIDRANLDTEHPFYDKKACFTGKLLSMPRKNAMEIFASYGGIPEKGVTRLTNFLVMGEQDLNRVASPDGKSSKIIKAEKLLQTGQQIELIGEQQFLQMFE